jgi:starch synthase
MKILYIALDVDIDGETGPSGHVREVIRNFTKFDMNTTLIAKSSKNKPLFSKVKIVKVRSIGLPGLGLVSRLFVNILIGTFELITNDYDIIYERHTYLTMGGILGRLFRIPVIYELNGIISDENKLHRDSIGTLMKYFEWWDRFAFVLPQKFITVTQGIKNYLIENYEIKEKDIVVVENGVSIDIFGYKSDNTENLDLNQDYNYICFIGVLAPWQGIEYLIKAAPSLLRQYPKVRFLIVGDGEMEKELMELTEKTGVSNNFIFTGSVPHEDIPLYINASDICVAYKKPLRSGYSALKLYEYMACGKPVIASRVRGFEILEENFAGILVEPENHEKLAEAMSKLLENKSLREEMGRNGKNHVVKNHSWEDASKKIEMTCKMTIADYKRNRKK